MSADDKFSHLSTGKSGPIDESTPVVPSDGTDLPFVTRALYVGTAGDIRMTMAGMDDGASVLRLNVAPGMWPWRIKRVWSTDTTATDMIGDF